MPRMYNAREIAERALDRQRLRVSRRQIPDREMCGKEAGQ
jgi:hypothetical protein